MKEIKDMWFPNRDLSSSKAINKAKHMVDFGYYFEALDEGLSYVKNRTIAIDGGANVGFWGIRMANTFEKVYSFEIDPETFQCLEKNVSQRNLENCIAINSGLSNKIGYSGIADGWNLKSMGCHLAPTVKNTSLKGRAKSNIRNEGKIETVTIDSLNLPDLAFLKLDVEGHESQAIEGGKETLLKFKPIVMMEYKPSLNKRYKGADPAAILKELGATLVDKIGKRDVEWIFAWK